MSDKKQEPTIDKISTLGEDEAKWTELKKIDWTDQTGRQRVWEAASRKNRGAAGVDAGNRYCFQSNKRFNTNANV